MTDYEKASKGLKNKYIDLKTNGRLFPSWILKNFKEYQLPEILRGDADPCNPTTNKTDEEAIKTSTLKLQDFQIFLSRYLDYTSPFKDILIYHGLGSGKTATSINIYNVLYSYTPGWNVFLLIKASLKKTWLDELNIWLKQEDKEYMMKNIVFINYDSPYADRDFLNAVRNADSSKKSMYVVEEAHNFIRNVYGNITSQGAGKKAQTIYDYIIQDKKENPDTRVILLSGTPAINNPFELALLFNLLRLNIFPKNENEFNQMFISRVGYEVINKRSKNIFMRRIMGLVSYYAGTRPDYFATKHVKHVDNVMSNYHEQIYNGYEDLERKAQERNRGSTSKRSDSSYMSYTRQASNFVFPFVNQRVNGENRPRPSKFRISERDAEKLLEGKADLKQEKTSDKFLNVVKYKETLDLYITETRNYFAAFNNDDIAKGHTIMDDVETFKTKYQGKYNKFLNNEKKKSTLFEALYTCSSKMINIAFNVMNSKGPTIVYSNYVYMEGIQIFKMYLDFFGFYNYMDDFKLRPGKLAYVEYHGGIDREDRGRAMDAYNQPSNIYGNEIRVILISQAGSEGLSLRNVKGIHITEPYWNLTRSIQLIGRGIRTCSHKDLPIEERSVDVYYYRSVKKDPNQITTDIFIENIARKKAGLIDSFLSVMKEVAVDCKLFEKQNMLTEQYKCFQFDEPSLFNSNPGPAYKEDLQDDMKIDNGLYSKKSVSLTIKVMEIKAVILKSKPDEEPRYSKPKKYLYYEKTGVVYDFDLHYAIGKIQMDNDGFPVKLDKETYIIDSVIPIPKITK
jgi:superfamily II DNA or RNA helicase